MNTVCFDLGNVLLFFDLAKMFAQLGTCCGLPAEEIKAMALPWQEPYERGEVTSRDLFHLFQTKATRSFTFEEFMEAMGKIFVPNTDLWPIVRRLKEQGVRLILISNTCESHYLYAKAHYPILELFDHKILSFEIGCMKPDPRIFQAALAHTKAHTKEKVFFTDDIPAFVASARNTGIDSELYVDVPTLQKHLRERGLLLF